MAASLAASRIDDSSLEKMSACINRQREVIANQDVLAYSKLDFEFHATVYDACGNDWLKELLETIKNKMRPLTLHMQPDFAEAHRPTHHTSPGPARDATRKRPKRPFAGITNI